MIQINVFFSFAKTQLGAIIYQFMIKYCLWLLMPKWGFKILRLLCSFLIKMHLESLLKSVLVMATDYAIETARKLDCCSSLSTFKVGYEVKQLTLHCWPT